MCGVCLCVSVPVDAELTVSPLHSTFTRLWPTCYLYSYRQLFFFARFLAFLQFDFFFAIGLLGFFELMNSPTRWFQLQLVLIRRNRWIRSNWMLSDIDQLNRWAEWGNNNNKGNQCMNCMGSMSKTLAIVPCLPTEVDIVERNGDVWWRLQVWGWLIGGYYLICCPIRAALFDLVGGKWKVVFRHAETNFSPRFLVIMRLCYCLIKVQLSSSSR